MISYLLLSNLIHFFQSVSGFCFLSLRLVNLFGDFMTVQLCFVINICRKFLYLSRVN